MLRQQGLKGCLACAANGRYRIVLMTRQGIKGSNIDLDGVLPVLAARQEPVSAGSCAPVSKTAWQAAGNPAGYSGKHRTPARINANGFKVYVWLCLLTGGFYVFK